jgi:transcriptional repressor NrdR
MRCPRCGERDTRVIDSRDLDEVSIRRRRECPSCATRFTTNERIEAPRLSIVKRDGSRQEFDREKLVAGMHKALTRRPVPDDAADRAAESSEVGRLTMEKLRQIDQIAYIRFASVYQSFEDLEALKREVDNLYAQRESGATVK